MSSEKSYEKDEFKVEDAQAPGMLTKPAREFTEKEEMSLYRRMDIRCMPILSLLYLLSFMDRGNIGNARLFSLEADLGMLGTTNYNIALSVYFLTYCSFEVPANLMLKYLAPSVWLSLITLAWGLVMTAMGLTQSYGGLLACRLFLGITEAGLFPGVTFLITTFYPRHKVQLRIALFFSAATMAGAFSGLLAYGIGFMDGVGGYHAWRWIFILEGIATMLAAILAYYAIVDSLPTMNFMNQEEKDWLIWRKSTDAGVAGESEHISRAYIIAAFTDWQVWLSTGYYIAIVVPLYSLGLFLPTIINSFGKYTKPEVQLLTIPVYFTACIHVLACAYFADKYKTRFLFVFCNNLLCLTGFVINIAPSPQPLKYVGLIFGACGAYASIPTTVTWLSNNLGGQTKRGIGMAFQIGVGNLGALASSNIYRTVDSPTYYLGHSVCIGFLLFGLCCSPTYAYILKKKNAEKAAVRAAEAALPEDQRRVYTAKELRELGDRAPDFIYTI